MADKKSKEVHCYDTAKEFVEKKLSVKTRSYLKSLFPIDSVPILSERPDFIINHNELTYGIEHFMVDFCYDGPKSNQSCSRIANKEIGDIFSKYHDPEIGTVRDDDMEDAVKKIEKEANKIANIREQFNYDRFIDGLTRTFQDHYGKVPIYKNNGHMSNSKVKIGFLIEFHCATTLMAAIYNGSIFKSKKRIFPVTYDMLALFENAVDLDFIVLAQYEEGVASDAKNVYIFEPCNIKKSIEIQHIRVCDRVIYESFPSNMSLHLKK